MIIAQKGFLVWVFSLLCAVKWHRQCCIYVHYLIICHLSWSFRRVPYVNSARAKSSHELVVFFHKRYPFMDKLVLKCIFVAAAVQVRKCKRKTSHAFTTECLWHRSTFEFKVTFNPYEAFILAERSTEGRLPGLHRCNQQTTIMTSYMNYASPNKLASKVSLSC